MDNFFQFTHLHSACLGEWQHYEVNSIFFSVWNMINNVDILSRTLLTIGFLIKCFLKKSTFCFGMKRVWNQYFTLFPWLLWQQHGTCYHGNQMFTGSTLGNKLFMHMECGVCITNIKKSNKWKPCLMTVPHFHSKLNTQRVIIMSNQQSCWL